MTKNPFTEIAKEQYICALELLKEYDHGTPEFDLAVTLINCYKSYMDAAKGKKNDSPT